MPTTSSNARNAHLSAVGRLLTEWMRSGYSLPEGDGRTLREAAEAQVYEWDMDLSPEVYDQLVADANCDEGVEFVDADWRPVPCTCTCDESHN